MNGAAYLRWAERDGEALAEKTVGGERKRSEGAL